mmetsp:Transcript_25829/g.73158  ORF Transcript_25829/g.73158 Transcript_25829/m.73158 type:complete len:268 (+) Transcript_25829:146-949(+)
MISRIDNAEVPTCNKIGQNRPPDTAAAGELWRKYDTRFDAPSQFAWSGVLLLTVLGRPLAAAPSCPSDSLVRQIMPSRDEKNVKMLLPDPAAFPCAAPLRFPGDENRLGRRGRAGEPDADAPLGAGEQNGGWLPDSADSNIRELFETESSESSGELWLPDDGCGMLPVTACNWLRSRAASATAASRSAESCSALARLSLTACSSLTCRRCTRSVRNATSSASRAFSARTFSAESCKDGDDADWAWCELAPDLWPTARRMESASNEAR